LEKLKSKKFSSFDDIDYYLRQHDIFINKRTLQRDLQTLRNEFLIEIPYDKKHNGYYIDYEESITADVESFMHFLEIINTAELLRQSLSEGSRSLKYVSFDSQGNFRGTGHLKPLFRAIRDRLWVTFNHLNYQSGKLSNYRIRPYGLREYQNRWYVVGITEYEDELWKFGLDRITLLEVETNVFERDENLDPHALFDHVIGVETSDEPLQHIVLSFDPQQGNYVKSLKLHHSQEVIIDSDEELRIRLHLKPNFELIQNILMHGSLVTVLEPEWLVDKMKSILNDALLGYSKNY
jgi:predicted DNA-binding transcriptional regulator YafY